jgi:exodeoxyribonuclease-3
MRIASWNVNGLRAAVRKGFADWLRDCDAEIVALQEVRARAEQLPSSVTDPEGWHFELAAAERPGYSGVALFSRQPPDALDRSLGHPRFDREGRVQIARFGALTVVNSYFPNGNGVNRDLSRIPYKIAYYRRLLKLLEPARRAGEPVLVMGDFNVAHREIDLARPKQNEKTSGFRPEERRELERWFEHGWIDTFRAFEPGGGHYTWWSQRKGVREKNIGWRLDLVLASPAAMEHVTGAAVHPEIAGSDHCPVSVEVEPAILG